MDILTALSEKLIDHAREEAPGKCGGPSVRWTGKGSSARRSSSYSF